MRSHFESLKSATTLDRSINPAPTWIRRAGSGATWGRARRGRCYCNAGAPSDSRAEYTSGDGSCLNSDGERFNGESCKCSFSSCDVDNNASFVVNVVVVAVVVVVVGSVAEHEK